VYEVISTDLKGINKALLLQMVVKAINDTAGPNGLVPTLLVFGSYLQLTSLDPPSPLIAQRAATIKRATEEVSKLYIARQITDTLQQRNGP
jgi:hypothetical protein